MDWNSFVIKPAKQFVPPQNLGLISPTTD